MTCETVDTMVSVQSFPDEILLQIFVHVPGHDLVSTCVCVCKQWEKIVQLQCLWKSKCILDYNYTMDMMTLMTTNDFRSLYFKNPYKRNLLKNPDAHDGKYDLKCYLVVVFLWL